MPQPIEIDFVAGGIASVLKAFDSLDAKAEQVERSVSGRVASGSRTRESTTKREVDTRQKEYEKLFREIEKSEAQAAKAAEKAAKSREKIRETSQRMAHRQLEQEVKNEADAANKRVRAVEEESKRKDRIRENSMRMAHRLLLEEVANEEHAAAKIRSARERAAKAIGTSIGRTVSGAGSLVSGALTVGGGFAVAGALREDLKFGEAVAQTSNAAFVEGDPRRTRAAADPAKIAALATSVQAGANIGKTDVVQALHKYVNLASDLTGMSEVNQTTGRTNLEEMARISKGTGADFGDLMTAAGYMKAQNPNMSSGELNLRMRQMVGAGAKGDISIADMAQHSELATAMAGQFSGDLGSNQAKLLGLTQIAGRVADPAQAAEAVNKFAQDVARHEDKLKAAGINVTTKDGKLRDAGSIIGDLFEKTGGNVGKLAALGIDARAVKLVEGFQRNYDEAESIQAGSGHKAVRREAADYENISFTQQSADQNFDKVMNTDTERLSKVFNELEETVAHAALPAFEEFVRTLSEHQGDIEAIITGLGKLATAFVDHPIEGVGLALIASVTKDVAAAGIGKALEAQLTSILSRLGGGGGGGGGTVVPGVGGGGTPAILPIGPIAAAVAVGTVLGQAGNAYLDSEDDKRAKQIANPDALKKDAAKRYRDILDLDKTIHDPESTERQSARAMGTKAQQEHAMDADVRQLKSQGIDFNPLKDALKELTKTVEKHGKTLVDRPEDRGHETYHPTRHGPTVPSGHGR